MSTSARHAIEPCVAAAVKDVGFFPHGGIIGKLITALAVIEETTTDDATRGSAHRTLFETEKAWPGIADAIGRARFLAGQQVSK